MTGRKTRSSPPRPNLSPPSPGKLPIPMPSGPEAAMADALFQVENLHLSLPDMTKKPIFGSAPRIRILKGLSFSMAEGAITGIVGESGSGKTSLGRTLIRLLKPDTGRIIFAGRDIAGLDDDAMRP